MNAPRAWASWLVLLGSCLQAGCRDHTPVAAGEKAEGPVWFADVTDEVGLDFVHDAGPPPGDWFMPQIVGSGVAVFDFNNDGLLDLYFLQNAGPKSTKKTNRLYQQMPGGRFRDVSKGSGLDIAGWNMGVAIGDVNNDGWPDVLVTQYLGVRLFLNNGNGTFTDVSEKAGLEDPLWGTSAAFVDYDRDGWLDVVIVNNVDYDASWPCSSPSGERDCCSPQPFKGTVSKLFHNLGKQSPATSVHFEDVSLASGIGRLPGPGLGVVCADFDGDGWPDIFIANDGQPNHLWINQHNGTFTEEAVSRGIAYNAMGQAEANMGIGWGDSDGDGLQDVFVTHLGTETNTLWKQGPRGLFRDATTFSALNRPCWRATGFGTLLGDFNHDGALDVVITNGRVAKGPSIPGSELGPFWSRYAERNQLFANDGKGRYLDISPSNPDLCGRLQIGRGLAMADIDGDGALDLVVTAVAGRARLYRNVAPNRGHWLMVRAFDPIRKRDVYAADVTIHAGERRWVRTINPAGSFLCSNDVRAHFGLGQVERIDAIEVRWMDAEDTQEVFAGGPVDRVVVLEKGKGRPVKKGPTARRP